MIVRRIKFEHLQTEELMRIRPIPDQIREILRLKLFYYMKNCCLRTVDYESESLKIDLLEIETTSEISNKLRTNFAWSWIAIQVISGAGLQFRTTKFSETWRFEHHITNSHHNNSNGESERTILKKFTTKDYWDKPEETPVWKMNENKLARMCWIVRPRDGIAWNNQIEPKICMRARKRFCDRNSE